jgi:hypothetical protein
LKPKTKKSPHIGVVRVTYATMMDAIFVSSASKHANRASMALGWFGVNLVAGPLLATPSAF